jgi:hypothetical protein
MHEKKRFPVDLKFATVNVLELAGTAPEALTCP